MIDKAEQDAILRSIALTGAASAENAKSKPVLDGNLQHILNLSSGSSRIQTNVIKRFNLILSQPPILSELNPYEVRCVLCRSVISYPAWYYSVRYAVNHFHYFVCFDESSPSKVTAKCYQA